MKSTLLPWISSIRLQLRSDEGDIVIARVGAMLALRVLARDRPTTDVIWRNEAVEGAHGLLTQQTIAFLGQFLVEAAVLTAGWDFFARQRSRSSEEIVFIPSSPFQSFRVYTRTETDRPHSFTIEPPVGEATVLQPLETATVASIASFATKWLRNKSELVSFRSIEINRRSAARELQRWEPRSSSARGSLTGIDTSA